MLCRKRYLQSHLKFMLNFDSNKNCPICDELTSSLGYGGVWIPSQCGWDDYAAAQQEFRYCPNCNAILEIWRREKEGGPLEESVITWLPTEDPKRWATQDLLFSKTVDPALGETIAEWTEYPKREVWNPDFSYLMKLSQFRRQQAGPRFVEDDDDFAVCIPMEGRTKEEAQVIIDLVRDTLRRKKSGGLLAKRFDESKAWARFREQNGFYFTTEMWLQGVLPKDIIFWFHNQGKAYQAIPWDWRTREAGIHDSVPPEKPQVRVFPLKQDATLYEAVKWLDDRLSDFEDDNPEMRDTLNRDELLVFLEAFIEGDPFNDYDSFSLDDEDAEQLLTKILKRFVKVTKGFVKDLTLTPKDRETALQSGPFLAEFLDER